MKWANGESFRPFEYRYFEGGNFPATLDYDGLKAKLKTSFRVWLRFDQLIQADAKKISDRERLDLALELCVEEMDYNFPLAKLMEGIVWFHGADANNRSWIFDKPKLAKQKSLYEKIIEGQGNKKKALNFFWDATAIWSAFMSAFNIDLFKADLHWWAFLALMAELPENCTINGLMRQRTQEIIKDKTIDEKDKGEMIVRQHLVSLPKGGILEGDGPDNERKK